MMKMLLMATSRIAKANFAKIRSRVDDPGANWICGKDCC